MTESHQTSDFRAGVLSANSSQRTGGTQLTWRDYAVCMLNKPPRSCTATVTLMSFMSQVLVVRVSIRLTRRFGCVISLRVGGSVARIAQPTTKPSNVSRKDA